MDHIRDPLPILLGLLLRDLLEPAESLLSPRIEAPLKDGSACLSGESQVVVDAVKCRKAGPEHLAHMEEMPQVGDRVKLGAKEFEIVEVMELMPPSVNFHFLHATCKIVDGEK